MRKHPKKLIIAMAGGGTGGHVMPIRSLLRTLFKTPHYATQVEKVFWFGSLHSLEAETAKEF
jgi:UDP-N-acetylglucosamine:LPS N-acetylglucosamine transferase